MRVALIGCGGRGKGAAANNLNACENTRIVAVADAFEKNAKEAAEMFQVPAEKVITHRAPLAEWEPVFDAIENLQALKALLIPPGAQGETP